MNVIHKFKREKLEIYSKIVTVVSYLEITNAHLSVTFWQDIFKMPQLSTIRGGE